MSETRIIYSEPEDYFPKETREKFMPELCVDSERYNEIARLILGGMLEKSSEKNIVFSPYSLFILLKILEDSTSGSTKKEVTRFLSMDKYNSSDTFSVINQHIKASDQFASTNAAIVRNDLKDYIGEKYIKMLKEKYGAELFASDNPIADVNSWVNEVTKGKIPEIADDSMKDKVLALINAVTFSARWLDKYEYDDIDFDDFTNDDESVSEVSMMSRYEDYYIEDNTFTGFIKKYKNDEYSFVGLLPKNNNKDSIKKAIQEMNISELYSHAEKTEVWVSIPEYKMEYEIDLSKLFIEEGIKEAFTDNASFSPISSEVPLKIQRIVHKACIEVDSKGTKASAVSTMDMVGSAPKYAEKEVILNRPFVYAIIHNNTHIPVFVGVVTQL